MRKTINPLFFFYFNPTISPPLRIFFYFNPTIWRNLEERSF